MSENHFDPSSLVGHIIDVGEIISTPTWDEDAQEWRALVAASPRGPLLLVAFKLKAISDSGTLSHTPTYKPSEKHP